jgi:hypothetical protein
MTKIKLKNKTMKNEPKLSENQEWQPLNYYTPHGIRKYPFKFNESKNTYVREMDGFHLFRCVKDGKINMVFFKIGFKK